MNKVVSAAVLTAAMLSGCMGGVEKGDLPRAETTAPADGPGEGRPFEGQLLEIARSYESYGPLEEAMKVSGFVCDFTPDRFLSGLTPAGTFTPETARETRKAPQAMHYSPGGDRTHGKKLYLLFAKYRYLEAAEGPTYPVGQAVVKEAWVPEEVKDEGAPLAAVTRKVKVHDGEREDRVLPYARRDGRLYHAKEKAGLFIMFKLDPATPGTDEGWVYGTVTADGKTVNAVGKIESCMKCHRDAPHDRLFGLPEEP